MWNKSLLASIILLLSANASAYIDPGTGGAIVGSIGPIIAGIIAIIVAFIGRHFIAPIKKAFFGVVRIFKKKQ